MNPTELLEHVLDNLKNDRPAGYGLIFEGSRCAADKVAEIFWECTEEYSKTTTQVINGVEVPIPLYKIPDLGTVLWCEDPTVPELATRIHYGEDDFHLYMLKKLCILHRTEKDAAACCRARYNVDEEDWEN